MGSSDERVRGSFFGERVRSFAHAFRGLGRFLREPNAQVHVLCAFVVLFLAWLLNLAPLEWAALVFAITLVLGAEAFNTALESLADAAVPERHALVGTAKDVAAAAVLLSALGAAAIGVLVLGPHLWDTWHELR